MLEEKIKVKSKEINTVISETAGNTPNVER